jgi:transposase
LWNSPSVGLIRGDNLAHLKTTYPETNSWAEEWTERIANLYRLNNERIKYNRQDFLFKEYNQKLREKLQAIYSLINEEYSHSAQTTIMKDMEEHWKGLTLLVDNPELPMDKNLAERMLRPMVLGRKNYWRNHPLKKNNYRSCSQSRSRKRNCYFT